MFAVEQVLVGSVVRVMVAETDAVAQTVVICLHDLAEGGLAPQSVAAGVVFALVAVAATAGEAVAVLVLAAAEFVLGRLDVVIAAVVVLTVVSVVQIALHVVAVVLQMPAAVMQSVAVKGQGWLTW